jgi:hypothetical protein
MKRLAHYRTVLAFFIFALLLLQPLAQDRVARRPMYSSASFSPSDIAGLIVWLKTDQITGLSDGDPVTTWSDQSSAANDATQSTSSKKPTYKTAIKNGLPVVRFDGVDDELQIAATLLNASGSTGTVFIVVSHSAGGNKGLFATRGTSAGGFVIRYSATNGYQYFHTNASPTLSRTISDSTWNLIEFRRNGLDVEVGHNGSLAAASTLSGFTAVSNGTQIGYQNGAFLTADVAEIVVYDSVLSDGNRGSVETYLNTKWAVY